MLAIGDDFLAGFAALPQKAQRKVQTFVTKFRSNPTAPSINYEPIHDVKDDRVRTVRIGLDYRAVVLHPSSGDTFVLVWVDHHDKAMGWARNKVFSVNPATGALQMIDVEAAEQAAAINRAAVVEETSRSGSRDDARSVPGLFDSVSDGDLEDVGLPTPLIPSVRSVAVEADLDRLHPYLPAEASEALYGIAAGLSLEDVQRIAVESREAVERTRIAADGAQDQIAVALQHPDSKRRFHVVEDERDLTEMLSAPLAQWRVFLHPTQRALVDREFRGPAQVMGGAGTGKTVVLMHRARHLARRLETPPGAKILVTSFTKNLTDAIETNLQTLCSDAELSRLEVRHIDSVAARVLRSRGEEFQIAENDTLRSCWDAAIALAGSLELPKHFYREEWERIVQPNNITERDAYLKAPRRGRGTPISRSMRAQVWEVFEAFRLEKRSRGVVEWVDVARRAREVVEKEGRDRGVRYMATLVDEAQDLHPEQWRLLRALIPPGANDIFIAGDAHQRIYARRVVLSQLGIEVRGRSRTLRVNYRTTERIRRTAVAVLQGQKIDDLDAGAADERGYRSLRDGVDPVIRCFPTESEERQFLVATIQKLVEERRSQGEDGGDDPYQSICVVARTMPILRDGYVAALEEAHIPFVVLDKDDPGTDQVGIRVANMHRVKGLEFPTMFIVGARDGIIPLEREVSGSEDVEVRDEALLRERSLLYTAALRARDQLFVTAAGTLTRFLAG